jgi:hypothetical protein
MAKEIVPLLLSGSTNLELINTFNSIGLDFGSYPNCLSQKLNNPTSAWTTAACGANPSVVNPKSNYAMSLTLKGLPLQGNYRVYTQIISTVKGNSDMSGLALDSGAGVTGTGSGISPMHIPSLYTIEVHGEKETNAVENSRLSVLYAF